MALIKCTECGKEFSDRAFACPNCGCPTEVVLQESNISTKQKDITSRYAIWGYDFCLEEKDERYILMKKTIREFRSVIMNDITDNYYQFGNIDELIEGLPEVYSNLLELMVSTAISILIQSGIYDCDIDTFIQKHGSSFDLTSLMEPIISRYLEIQNFEKEANEYREYVRQQRLHTWKGGGFGIKGALKGYFKAQLLNIGTEFLHLHSDNINHNKNMIQIAKAKSDLYEAENTKNLVKFALMNIYDSCFNAVFVEMENNEKISKKLFDEEKATCIINNIFTTLNSEEYDLNIIKNQCLIAFQLDPARQDLINLMIRLEEETETSDLIKYAKDFKFYDLYLENMQKILENKYHEEIVNIKHTEITTKILFVKLLSQCKKMQADGLYIGDLFEQICKSRSKYPISSEEYNQLLQLLHTIDFDEEAIVFQKIFNDIEFDDTNQDEVKELIKKYCAEYSRNQKEDFYFMHDSKVDIKKTKEYLDFKEYCNLPDEVEVYLTFAKFNTSNPKVMIVITDKGLYIYDGGWSKEFYSWKEYAESKIEMSNYNIRLGSELFDFYCDEDLKKLFFELHDELNSYFSTGESKFVYKRVPNDEDREQEDIYAEKIDLDYNEFVKSFCIKLSKEDTEYETKITTYDGSNMLGINGFEVFWTCGDKQTDIDKYWSIYKGYFEFDDDVKLYAIDALIWGKEKEHVIVLTSVGLYMYQRYGENETGGRCAWDDLSLVPYYLIDKYNKNNPQIVLGNAKFRLGGRSTNLIICLRNELRQFTISNCKQVREKFQIDRLIPSVAQKIWDICRSFYPAPMFSEYRNFHKFLLLNSDKKTDDYVAPKDAEEYLFDRITLNIPEDDEIYYMFARNIGELSSYRDDNTGMRFAFYITNSGIYWYDRTAGGGSEEWFCFDNCELRLKCDEGIYIDDNFICLKEESSFIFKILKKVQDYLISISDKEIIETDDDSIS